MSDETGRRLKAARGYGGLSQPALARALEVSEGTIKNIELGKRPPRRSELLAIAEACEVPMWFLEGGWEGWRGSVDAKAQDALTDLDERHRTPERKAHGGK